MTDLLLKFPDRETAIQVGIALGLTSPSTEEDGEYQTIHGNSELAVHVIGPHEEANWWVMVRVMVDMVFPEAIIPFIAWQGGERDPSMPQDQWLS